MIWNAKIIIKKFIYAALFEISSLISKLLICLLSLVLSRLPHPKQKQPADGHTIRKLSMFDA